MSKPDYRNKRIAILGLSTEGKDATKFFVNEGAHVTCCDRRTREELIDTIRELSRYPVSFRLGIDYLSHLENFDMLVRTPGMALFLPELIDAKYRGIPITSATQEFFRNSKAPVIGVTGTKGKGTTSTLIAEILKASGKTVHLGGNIGTPLLSKVTAINPTDRVVLELSSFQLEDLTVSPHIAVVLRTTQEHLANFDPLATNYHKTRVDYVNAKKQIVRYQKPGDFAVLNHDDPVSSSFAKETQARVYYFSRETAEVDAYVSQGTVFLRNQGAAREICNSQAIELRGLHNLENIAAASIAASLAGAKIQTIQNVIKTFPGLEHRLELVRTLGRVAYYNDSFSTVPETAIAAIRSFTEPLLLIVGGSEKGSDFSELGKVIAESRVKVLIVIGQMKDRILNATERFGFGGKVITHLTSMEAIVQTASSEARAGDVVLLSPACASFDMFKNYKERGMQFKDYVKKLKEA